MERVGHECAVGTRSGEPLAVRPVRVVLHAVARDGPGRFDRDVARGIVQYAAALGAGRDADAADGHLLAHVEDEIERDVDHRTDGCLEIVGPIGSRVAVEHVLCPTGLGIAFARSVFRGAVDHFPAFAVEQLGGRQHALVEEDVVDVALVGGLRSVVALDLFDGDRQQVLLAVGHLLAVQRHLRRRRNLVVAGQDHLLLRKFVGLGRHEFVRRVVGLVVGVDQRAVDLEGHGEVLRTDRPGDGPDVDRLGFGFEQRDLERFGPGVLDRQHRGPVQPRSRIVVLAASRRNQQRGGRNETDGSISFHGRVRFGFYLFLAGSLMSSITGRWSEAFVTSPDLNQRRICEPTTSHFGVPLSCMM